MKEFLKNRKLILLALVVLAQGLVLAGEYLNSVYPLWFGKEVTLAIRPVDPRSLFRGQYVQLDYDISRIRIGEISKPTDHSLRMGEMVYVKLQEGSKGLWIADRASLNKPSEGLFIRGRVSNRMSRWQDKRRTARLRYGIEAYFASPKRAKELEQGLRRGGRETERRQATATVMIAPNGKAALVDIDT